MKRILTILFLTFTVGSAAAQNAAFSSDVAMRFLNNPANYLQPVDTLRAIESAVVKCKSLRYLFYNDLGTYSSFISDYQTALQCFDSLAMPKRVPDAALRLLSANFAGYRPVNAQETIVRLAASRQVTMINESHHIPYHRLFTKLLLKDLYRSGYRYLALEAFHAPHDSLNARKYPVQNDGYYLAEPLFGDMVRTAQQIGYKIVAYEDSAPCTTNCREQRERNQAKNLYNILQQDPAAKVLVHVGYDHLLEREKDKIERMAGHFKAISGIDPFTINQNLLCERSHPDYENKYYEVALRQFNITQPTVLMKEDSIWVAPENKGFFDMQVIHPRYPSQNNRPGYFGLDKARTPTLIPVKKAYDGMLLQAFVASENHAFLIPVDQVVIHANNKNYLLLPPGKHHIVVRNNAGNIVAVIKQPS